MDPARTHGLQTEVFCFFFAVILNVLVRDEYWIAEDMVSWSKYELRQKRKQNWLIDYFTDYSIFQITSELW